MVMSTGAALGSAAIGATGGIGGAVISAISARKSAKRAFKYSLQLQENQYRLNRRALREQYQNSRYSLEQAGYNPLLAVGSSAQGVSTGASQSPSENVDGSAVVNSALSAAQIKSQIKNTEANSALSGEQAETEKAKRVQMQFQNAMTDVETKLKQKDLDTYDKRFYANLYEQMQRAENYRANSAIGMMNAETERMNAITNRSNSDTNRNIVNYEKNRYDEWRRRHPYQEGFLYGAGQYTSTIGKVFGGSASYGFSAKSSPK